MIKAVIFDLDGLLIDSEPLWQQAEILVFEQVNIKLTPELCLQTKGLCIDEVVDYWYQKYPWTNLAKSEAKAIFACFCRTKDIAWASPGRAFPWDFISSISLSTINSSTS
ncbi:MAG: HAD hydrolase-like protein, partial [Cyanobacteria bacterium P01_E01_bin.35]